VFLVRSGSVLIQPDESSGRRICLDEIREGGVFGGIGLLSELDLPLCAVAGTDSVLVEIDAGSFGYLERSRPRTAERLRELIIDRVVCQLSESLRYMGVR
jgi:CRP-like cAMP-binding protein